MDKVKEKKKIIQLPEGTIKNLALMAKGERMAVKPYMEKILINHASNNSKHKK